MSTNGVSVPDGSELTLEELEVYGERYKESLAKDYHDEMLRLYLEGRYPNTKEGWDVIKEVAWTTARANNLVGKEITALSAARRQEREVSETEGAQCAADDCSNQEETTDTAAALKNIGPVPLAIYSAQASY